MNASQKLSRGDLLLKLSDSKHVLDALAVRSKGLGSLLEFEDLVTSQRGFIPQLCVLNEPSLEFLPSDPATDWSLTSDLFYIPSWSQRRGRVEMTQTHWSRRLGETHVGSTHRQKCSNTHFALKSQTCTAGLRVKQHAESHTTALRRHSSQASIHPKAPLASHFTITPTHQTTQAQPAQSSYPSDFLYVYEKLRTALSLAGFGGKKHRGKR